VRRESNARPTGISHPRTPLSFQKHRQRPFSEKSGRMSTRAAARFQSI
jgi:hypothetical protein